MNGAIVCGDSAVVGGDVHVAGANITVVGGNAAVVGSNRAVIGRDQAVVIVVNHSGACIVSFDASTAVGGNGALIGGNGGGGVGSDGTVIFFKIGIIHTDRAVLSCNLAVVLDNSGTAGVGFNGPILCIGTNGAVIVGNGTFVGIDNTVIERSILIVHIHGFAAFNFPPGSRGNAHA